MTDTNSDMNGKCSSLMRGPLESSISFLIIGDRWGTQCDGSMKEHNILCIHRAMVAGLEKSNIVMSTFTIPRISCTDVVPRIDEEGRFYITCGKGWSLTGDTISFPQDDRNPRIRIIHSLGEHIGQTLGLPYVYIQAGTGPGRIVMVSAANTPDLLVLRAGVRLAGSAGVATPHLR